MSHVIFCSFHYVQIHMRHNIICNTMFCILSYVDYFAQKGNLVMHVLPQKLIPVFCMYPIYVQKQS